MYLARLPDINGGSRYFIRHSYDDDGHYRHRDLFDLGDDPSRYIVYPGGNGFYIDMVVEDAIADLGISVSQADLEPVFMPFLSPRIRRVIDGFDRKTRVHPLADACMPAGAVHRFDRYRLHFLKLGRVDQRDMTCTPDRFYAGLAHKSRDEIEFDFIAAERILKSEDVAHYIYQAFDLQRFFNERYARSHPEGLDQDRMDRFFIETLCGLNQDASFWMGEKAISGLQPHLKRYAIMYFDSQFPTRDPFHEYLHDFLNRHRIHRWPEKVKLSLEESAGLFGVPVETLRKMDCKELTRRYRQLAQTHHPDKGGDQEAFVNLSAAYRRLLNRKSFN